MAAASANLVSEALQCARTRALFCFLPCRELCRVHYWLRNLLKASKTRKPAKDIIDIGNALKLRYRCYFREKPTLFYTDTLRGFRAQGCASDRHKAPRSSLEEARWGDWRLIGAQARSRKRSTSGRVKTGSACPGVCAEPTRRA